MSLNLLAVFLNYYDGKFINDGITVNFYDRVTNQFVDSTIIGNFPARPNQGEGYFSNLQEGLVYKVEFSGTDIPTGTNFAYVPIDSEIFSVPIFFQGEDGLITFTNTTSAIILEAPGNYLGIPVYDASIFSAGEYIIVANEEDAFLALISSVDTINNIIDVVVVQVFAGNIGDVIPAGALVALYAPNKFQGPQGLPGTNSSSSTVTTNTITVSTSGTIYEVDVFDGSAFPNGTTLLISDNINTFTGYVSAGGTSNQLFVYAISTPVFGYVFNPGSFVTFSGPQGIQGLQGIQGEQGIQGIQGVQGIQGPGTTYTLMDITCPNLNTSQPFLVNDNQAFPVGSYLIVTAGLNLNFSGVVTNTVAATGIIVDVQQTNGYGNIIPAGSTVTFSGPASNVAGPQGIQGNQGLQGETGVPGHGSTICLNKVPIMPIGTQIQVLVQDPIGFPPLSYAIITDGVYSMIGQITAVSITSSMVGFRIIAIPNGNPGFSTLQGATMSYSGIPGPKNIFNIGQFGTVLYKDIGLYNVNFNSGASINNVTALKTLTLNLPNNLPINYRVVAEFDGSVYTNNVLTSSNAIIGIASNNASSVASDAYGTLSGVGEPIQAMPNLNYRNVIADGIFQVGTVNNPSASTHLKYAGTIYSGNQVDFTIAAAAYQQFASFYVQGILNVTAYPLYS